MWVGRGFDNDGDGGADFFVGTHIDKGSRNLLFGCLSAVIVVVVVAFAALHVGMFSLTAAERAVSFLWQHGATICWFAWGALVFTLLALVIGAGVLNATVRLKPVWENTKARLHPHLNQVGTTAKRSLFYVLVVASVAAGIANVSALGTLVFTLLASFVGVGVLLNTVVPLRPILKKHGSRLLMAFVLVAGAAAIAAAIVARNSHEATIDEGRGTAPPLRRPPSRPHGVS